MPFDDSSRDGARIPDLAQLRRLARHWIAYVGPRRIVGGAVSAVVVCTAGWILVRPSSAPVEARIPRVAPGDSVNAGATTVAALAAAAQTAPVMKVHVAGAVKNPGVYTMAPGSRVVDAVRAAGGATARADLERINLAQVIIDTEQVYVPPRTSRAPRVTVAPRLRPIRNAVPASTTTVAAAGEVTAVPSSGGASSRVDLNSATAAQLDSLPGVGPATARAIISYRARKGPFSKVEDLMNVPGIGPAKFAALRDLVSV